VPDEEATLWVVAGCLFEVSLPVIGARPWRWTNAGREVSLLGEAVRHGRRHFRFRAESGGAEAGLVELRFRSDDGEHGLTVPVRVAPEQFDEGR
jgi:hypothetical protein